MKDRDIAAFIVGIILGGLATYLDLIAAAWFGLPGIFVLCGLLFPLFVSLLAERRIILAGLIPNLVMMLCITTYFLILTRQATVA